MRFKGQLQRIHDYMFHIAVAVMIFIVGFIIVYNNLPKQQFAYSDFISEQQQFKQCVNNPSLFDTVNAFEKSYRQLPLVDVSAQYQSLKALIDREVPPNCKMRHVESSYEQLQQVALSVITTAQDFFDSEDVKAVNAVYTPSSLYSALLNAPQPYLFFISDKNQNRIVAMRALPSEESVQIEPLWQYENSKNLNFTQAEVQKLLLVYNEIKR
ncbi:hypothetical protein ACLKMH_21530 [Psychromonas sp. KJ10-10]|uniref:hypothetical protein n=1 Tax=Psychromonas sp. KJ10-10 TaxID=3391823 RepID=UPI0039B388C6